MLKNLNLYNHLCIIRIPDNCHHINMNRRVKKIQQDSIYIQHYLFVTLGKQNISLSPSFKILIAHISLAFKRTDKTFFVLRTRDKGNISMYVGDP